MINHQSNDFFSFSFLSSLPDVAGIETNFTIPLLSILYLAEEKIEREGEQDENKIKFRHALRESTNPAWIPSSVIDFCQWYFRRELVTWSNINRLHCDAKQKWRDPATFTGSSILWARWVHALAYNSSSEEGPRIDSFSAMRMSAKNWPACCNERSNKKKKKKEDI